LFTTFYKQNEEMDTGWRSAIVIYIKVKCGDVILISLNLIGVKLDFVWAITFHITFWPLWGAPSLINYFILLFFSLCPHFADKVIKWCPSFINFIDDVITFCKKWNKSEGPSSLIALLAMRQRVKDPLLITFCKKWKKSEGINFFTFSEGPSSL
jgi:hypothetical protein